LLLLFCFQIRSSGACGRRTDRACVDDASADKPTALIGNGANQEGKRGEEEKRGGGERKEEEKKRKGRKHYTVFAKLSIYM